jgi:hypothetical protein
VHVLDYGATVQALLVPDRQGRVEDVGLERVEDYVACPAFVGRIVGRRDGFRDDENERYHWDLGRASLRAGRRGV